MHVTRSILIVELIVTMFGYHSIKS